MTEREPGFRYSYGQCHGGMVPSEDKPGWFTPGPVDYYFICCDGTLKDDLGEHFATREEAAARVSELNWADAEATLSLRPVDRRRRARLRALGQTFWMSYGEGHPALRIPERPPKYALRVYSDRYGENFWETYRTLLEVEEAIKGEDVDCVVDLDTGAEIPFTVQVTVGAA